MALQFILPALFMAGSLAANQIGARSQQRALSGANEAERIRQRGFRGEAEEVNERSRERFEGIEAKQGAETSRLAEMYAPRRAEALGRLPQASNTLVAEREDREMSEAEDFGRQQGDALAKLRSFGTLFGDLARGQARDGSDLATVLGLSRGSSGVLPLELQAAQRKGGGMRMLGDLLSMGGQAGLSYALGPKLPTDLPGAFPTAGMRPGSIY